MKFKAVSLAAASAVLLAACSTPSKLAMQGKESPSEALMNQREVGLQHCDYVTGSRINRPTDGACRQSSYPFRSFSREDLESTGYVGLGEQLRSIDFAFSQ